MSRAAEPAAALREHYAALGEKLARNQFQQPLILDSVESEGRLSGDVYALVNHPYATVSASLVDPAHWCDVLILHLNIKYCRPEKTRAGTVLAVEMGTKREQSLRTAYRVDFAFRVLASATDYFRVEMRADKSGDTDENRLFLEAIPADGDRTFLHLSYSYTNSLSTRMAMKTYLATVASEKVGFTVVGRKADGQPQYIGGVRGMVERNTMRYFLAIETYLATLSAPAGERLEKRLQGWFAATERYARQLHEVERADYLAMKRSEYARQQTLK